MYGQYRFNLYDNGNLYLQDHNVIKADYTIEKFYIGWKVLGPLGKWLGGLLGDVAANSAAEEAVVVTGRLTGKGYSATAIINMLKMSESEPMKVIFRALTGSEVRNGPLFFAEDRKYAESFLTEGKDVIGFAIPERNFQYFVQEHLIDIKNGINSPPAAGSTVKAGTEFVITDPAFKQMFLKYAFKIKL